MSLAPLTLSTVHQSVLERSQSSGDRFVYEQGLFYDVTQRRRCFSKHQRTSLHRIHQNIGNSDQCSDVVKTAEKPYSV